MLAGQLEFMGDLCLMELSSSVYHCSAMTQLAAPCSAAASPIHELIHEANAGPPFGTFRIENECLTLDT